MKVLINIMLITILFYCFFYINQNTTKDKFSAVKDRQNDLKFLIDKYIGSKNLNTVLDGEYELNTNDREHIVLKVVGNTTKIPDYSNLNKYVSLSSKNYSDDLGLNESFIKIKTAEGYSFKNVLNDYYLNMNIDDFTNNVESPVYYDLELKEENNIILRRKDTNREHKYLFKIIYLCDAIKDKYKNINNYYELIYENKIYGKNEDKTRADVCKKTFNAVPVVEQLRKLSNYIDINNKFTTYLTNELDKSDNQLDDISKYTLGTYDDPGRYIQREYVLNVLDYQADKIAMDKLNYEKVKETFQEGERLELPINDEILTEEEELILYPQKPSDFYGDYLLIHGQFRILDNFVINLTATGLTIKDSTGKKILFYELDKIQPKIAPNFPLTTIEILLNKRIIKKDDQIVRDTPDQILQQKQRNLLYHLGIKENRLYLFGSEGFYRLYNNNRTLICHLKRLTTQVI